MAERGNLMIAGRVVAAVDALGRAGARMIEVAHEEETTTPDGVLWWCEANFNGHRVFSVHFPYPAQAAEDLLGRVLNGGRCRRCDRTTILGIDVEGYCCFWVQAEDIDDPQTYRYVRTCDEVGP